MATTFTRMDSSTREQWLTIGVEHLDTNRGQLSINTTGSTHGHPATTAANSFGVAATPARSGGTPSGPYPSPFSGSNTIVGLASGDFPPTVDDTALESRLITWLRFQPEGANDAPKLASLAINATPVTQRAHGSAASASPRA